MKGISIHKFPFLALFFAVFASVIIPGCSKKQDDPAVPGKQLLMTIRFTGDYINPKLKAIVFVSDMAGNPLADTTVSGNPTVSLFTSQAAAPPYQVTIVKWEPDMHNFLVTMNTYLYVMPGEWTIRGNRPVSSGNATYSLRNVPTHQGPILTACSGHSNLTFATSGTLPVFEPPDNLYVKLNTAQGPLYKWAAGLVAGAGLDIDLALMDAASEHTISFPVPALDFIARLQGFHDTDHTADLPVLTDEILGDGTARDKVVVSYPPSSFASFQTYVEMIENWTSGITYFYTKSGAIPNAFAKTSAMVSGIEASGSRVSFSATGSFTLTSAQWFFLDAANLAFEWTVHGPDTITAMTVPGLPEAMTAMFPSLSPDSLHLGHLELTGYPAAASYPAYLKLMFDPAHPGRGSYLEASGVRVAVN
jgi:hypothetical protein